MSKIDQNLTKNYPNANVFMYLMYLKCSMDMLLAKACYKILLKAEALPLLPFKSQEYEFFN